MIVDVIVCYVCVCFLFFNLAIILLGVGFYGKFGILELGLADSLMLLSLLSFVTLGCYVFHFIRHSKRAWFFGFWDFYRYAKFYVVFLMKVIIIWLNVVFNLNSLGRLVEYFNLFMDLILIGCS